MLESFYNRFIYSLESLLKPKYWYLYTALFTFAVICFLTAPNYFAFTKGYQSCPACVDYQAKINRADHLLKPDHYVDAYHMAKTQFRITVPLIAKITGIRSVIAMFMIQQLFGLLFLAIACLLTYKITSDKVISSILTLSLGFIYAGKAAFVDTVGFTDSFAYCFLLCALFTKNKPLLILNLQLAFFTDERAIITSSIIAIYFFVEYLQTTNNKFHWDTFVKSRLFVIFISWALCFLIRYLLHVFYGFRTPFDGFIDFSAFGYFFWEGLKGFWLLVIGCCIYLFLEKRYFILVLVITAISIILATTAMVSDVTRSVAYIFPIIFLAVFIFEQAVSRAQLRKIVIIAGLISFLSADSFYVVGSQPIFYRSLPVKILDKLFKK